MSVEYKVIVGRESGEILHRCGGVTVYRDAPPEKCPHCHDDWVRDTDEDGEDRIIYVMESR